MIRDKILFLNKVRYNLNLKIISNSIFEDEIYFQYLNIKGDKFFELNFVLGVIL